MDGPKRRAVSHDRAQIIAAGCAAICGLGLTLNHPPRVISPPHFGAMLTASLSTAEVNPTTGM